MEEITKYVDFYVSLCSALRGPRMHCAQFCRSQSAFFEPKHGGWLPFSLISARGPQRPQTKSLRCECGRWWHFILHPRDPARASWLDEQPLGLQRHMKTTEERRSMSPCCCWCHPCVWRMRQSNLSWNEMAAVDTIYLARLMTVAHSPGAACILCACVIQCASFPCAEIWFFFSYPLNVT